MAMGRCRGMRVPGQRPVGCPCRPREIAEGESALVGIENACRTGALRCRNRDVAPPAGREVGLKQASCRVVENVESGAGARIHLQKEGCAACEHKVEGEQPDKAERAADGLDGGGHARRDRWLEADRARRAAVTVNPRRDAGAPLTAEQCAANGVPVGNGKDGDRLSGDAALEVAFARDLRRLARNDMRAAAAADTLGQPAARIRRRIEARLGVRDAQPIEQRKKRARVFGARNLVGIVADERDAPCQRRDQLGHVLEA